ncbi:MAG: GAF domain-containing protein [Anaerolineae bacterium]
MEGLHNPYAVIPGLAAMVAAALVFLAWLRHYDPLARSFAVLMFAVAEWAAALTFQYLSTGLEAKLFWAQAQYVGITIVPVAWLVLALQYAHREALLNPRIYFLLSTEPVVTMLLAWTNRFHHMIWASVNLDAGGRFLNFEYGPGYWIDTLYFYLVILVGTLLFAHVLIGSPRPYRTRTRLMLAGVLVPWLGNTIRLIIPGGAASLPAAPMGFVFSGLALYWGLFRLHLSNILPLARASLIEEIGDGVLVLDAVERVIDLNPAAQQMIGVSAEKAVGKPVGKVFPPAAAQPSEKSLSSPPQVEIVYGRDETRRLVEWRGVVLHSRDGRPAGRLVTLRDISRQQETESALQQYAERLQVLNEINRAILAAHDPKEIADIALRYLRQLVPATRASVVVMEEESESAWVLAISADRTRLGIGREVPLDALLQSDLLYRGEAAVVEDLQALPALGPLQKHLFDEGIRTYINIPLIAQEQLIGTLNLGAEKPGSFTPEDIEIARKVAGPLAVGIQQARLYEQAESRAIELRDRERHLMLLNDITRAAAGILDLDRLMQTLADMMGQLIDADDCHITLWDEARQQVIPAAASGPFRYNFRSVEIKPDQVTITESVLRAGHALAIEDVFNTPYLSPEIARMFSYNSILGLPMIAGELKLGAVIIMFSDPHRFTAEEIAWGEQAAAHIALAVAKAKVLKREQEQRQLAESLREAGVALGATLEFDAVLDGLLQQIGRIVPYDTATIMLVENGQARVAREQGHAVFGPEVAQKIRQLSFVIEETPNLQQMAKTRRPFIIPDVREYAGWITVPGGEYIRSWAGAPILIQDRLAAVFSIVKSEPGFYDQEQIERLSVFAAQAGLALQNAYFYQEIRRQLRELSILHAIATAGTEAMHEDDLIEFTTELMVERSYPDNFGILLLDEAAGVLRPHPSYHTSEPHEELLPLALGQGIAGRVVQTGSPERVPDVSKDPAFVCVDSQTRSELCVPLKVGERIIGVINAESQKLDAFTETDEQFLLTLAGQLATAIENSRLFAAERARRQEAETLREAITSLTSTLDLDQVLDSILFQLQQVIPYDSAAVMLTEGDKLRIVAGRGFPNLANVIGNKFPADNPLVLEIFHLKAPICLYDAQEDPRFRRWGETNYVHGWMGVPLIARGEVMGILTVDSLQAGIYGEAETVLAQALASQAAVAIYNARLFQETRRRAAELEALTDISAALRAAQEVEEMLDIILRKTIDVVGADVSSIYLIENESGELVGRGVFPYEPGLVGSHYSLGQGITGHVAATGATHISENLAADLLADFSEVDAEYLKQIQSNICLPLRAQERVVGVMHVSLMEPHRFSDTEVGLLTAISEMAGSALDRATVLETLEQRVIERTRELAEANKRLQELDQLKSKFVSDVSHELRTPITNLSLYVDLLEQGKPEKRKQYISILQKQATRLATLVEDILNLSRLEMGAAKPQLAPVDLNQVVRQIVTAHLPRAEAADLDLRVDLQSDLPPVNGERNQLAQVVTNLLVNAINYTSAGNIWVSTSWDSASEQACLMVKDTGLGILPEDLEHLFERFYRGQQASQSNIPGTGLGLAITKEIIDLHGGRIEVESEAAVGSTFRVWLNPSPKN